MGRFSVLDISTVGIVWVPKRSSLETAIRRELWGDVSLGIDAALVVEQSCLENNPSGV